MQVILTTYDSRLADWTMSNHDHRGLIAYELNLVDPRAGTVPTQTSDMFSRLMLDAEDNLNAPTARGRRAACGSYRSAAERLAKQIIATGRTQAGAACSVADVDAEASMLGNSSRSSAVSLLITGEGSMEHLCDGPESWNHDDDVPSTAELRVVEVTCARSRRHTGSTGRTAWSRDPRLGNQELDRGAGRAGPDRRPSAIEAPTQ